MRIYIEIYYFETWVAILVEIEYIAFFSFTVQYIDLYVFFVIKYLSFMLIFCVVPVFGFIYWRSIDILQSAAITDSCVIGRMKEVNIAQEYQVLIDLFLALIKLSILNTSTHFNIRNKYCWKKL